MRITAIIALLAAIGCADAHSNGELPSSDLASTLERGVSFDLQPSVDDSGVRAQAVALRQDRETLVEASLEGGIVGLRADAEGGLSLDKLSLDLGDISVPADILPPNGIELTDVSVQLSGTVRGDAEWTADGERCDVNLDVSLALKWSMLRDGRPIPLGDVNVSSVPVVLTVEEDGDGQVLTLAADRTGAFWSWANTFELRDLSIELNASR